VITEFFRRIGITELRFKPAYNPYTEPSMEVFGYHPDLKKWTEIGSFRENKESRARKARAPRPNPKPNAPS